MVQQDRSAGEIGAEHARAARGAVRVAVTTQPPLRRFPVKLACLAAGAVALLAGGIALAYLANDEGRRWPPTDLTLAEPGAAQITAAALADPPRPSPAVAEAVAAPDHPAPTAAVASAEPAPTAAVAASDRAAPTAGGASAKPAPAALVASVLAAPARGGADPVSPAAGMGAEDTALATAAPPPAPAQFDAAAYLDAAVALAGGVAPGAQLVKLSLFDVRADGTIDLSDRVVRAVYGFRIGAAGGGASPQSPCLVNVLISGRQVTVRGLTDESCDRPLLAAPRCSPADVWRRARALGAPPELTASLHYLAKGEARVWAFIVAEVGLSLELPDDCG